MDVRDKILSFIQQNGPLVPTTIAKQLEINSLFASAYLSEMKETGKIKISSLKLGGSPLYYLPGQEEILQKFSDNLGEKEKRIYLLLKERKVIQDIKLVPVFRAAIRAIKDFASSFTINDQLFWKWATLSIDEATEAANILLGTNKFVQEKELQIETKEPEKKIEEKEEKIAEKIENKEDKPEKTEILQVSNKSSNEFIDEIRRYFSENNIKILEETIIRKSDIDFIVDVPSSVGSLRYYVKAKSKKKLNDGDLSSAFIQAQTKRMPALLIGKGDLTKKAKEMLEIEFNGMRYNKI